MASSFLRERFAELERLAKAAGLRPYDVHFFEVPTSVIFQVASYGLPTRYNHWSFGKHYEWQKAQSEMGSSKIYELVLNNSPSYAFLDDSNPDIVNLLVCAHVLAHSDFFANNIMFKQCGETNMIEVAKHHANIIDGYRKEYGEDDVDEWLDIALSLERHIDIYKGLKRDKYPKRHIEYKQRTAKEWEDLLSDKDKKPIIEKIDQGFHIPPSPEKDILWFLSNYANIEDWKKRIFEIVRRESRYFYPQYMCVTGNSLIYCPNKGLVKINRLSNCKGTVEYDIPIISKFDNCLKTVNSSHFHCFEKNDVIKITTNSGFEIEGTPEHPIEVLDEDLNIKFKKIDEITGKEYIILYNKTEIFGSFEYLDDCLQKYSKSRDLEYQNRTNPIGNWFKNNPQNWIKLAKLSGYLCAKGKFEDGCVLFRDENKHLVDDFLANFNAIFIDVGLCCHMYDSYYDYHCSILLKDSFLYEFLNYIGFDSFSSSLTKEIPWFVLSGPREVQQAFMSAYFECYSAFTEGKLTAFSNSCYLSKQLQLVLLNFGIYSKTINEKEEHNCKYFCLEVFGEDIELFIKYIGFITDAKNNIDASFCCNRRSIEEIPFLLQTFRNMAEKYQRGNKYLCSDGILRHLSFSKFSKKTYSKIFSLSNLRKSNIINECGYLDHDFKVKLQNIASIKNPFFDGIKSKIKSTNKKTTVYDLTVPGCENFLCNGIINHNTRVKNEGWASYWHAELMHQYSLGNDNDYGVKDIKYTLTSEEHLDFLSYHEKVVQPGLKIPLKIDIPEINQNTGLPTGRKYKSWNPRIAQNPKLFYYATRLNPYYVGFKMYRHIKKKWDTYFKQGFMEDEWGKKIPVTIDGAAKIRQVMEEENDVSFLRNYLDEEICDELHLFSYGTPDENYKDDYLTQEEIAKRFRTNGDRGFGTLPIDKQIIHNRTISVRTKQIRDIINAFARDKNNYGVPSIVIRRVDSNGTLRLEHTSDDKANIDLKYAEWMLEYVYKVWGRRVELIRRDIDKTQVLKYDTHHFDIEYETTEYPDSFEKNDSASSL